MENKKKIVCIALIICMSASIALSAFAAFDDSKLTWDGQPITLKVLGEKLDYDMADANGNYKPMYYYFAKDLWNKGLMQGSDGSFNLDKPLTRTEGVIMALRLLGKEQEAMEAKLSCPFADVPQWAKYQVAYAAKNGITSGYSETKFGASDTMTANQYITFVLRAMGYSEQGGDFVWSRAADKALEIDLIGAPCREQYMHSNLFLRDNVAVISSRALSAAKTKSGGALGDMLKTQAPTGDVPFATVADRDAAKSGVKPEPEEKPEGEKPTEEKPPITWVAYERFGVPQYESADSSATRIMVKDETEKLYMAYSDSAYATEDYKAILRDAGFYSQGTINFEPETVTSVSGGITYIGTKAWVCDWYSNGDVHVVFGKVGNAFIVRVYAGAVNTMSANGLRSFYMNIKS